MNTQKIKVTEIKKGMEVKIGTDEFWTAHSDSFTHNGTWSIMVDDTYRYGFSCNPNELITIKSLTDEPLIGETL